MTVQPSILNKNACAASTASTAPTDSARPSPSLSPRALMRLEWQLENDFSLLVVGSRRVVELLKHLNIMSGDRLLQLHTALLEILNNAMEHGNLEIGGDLKSEIMARSFSEYFKLIEQRCLSENLGKRRIRMELVVMTGEVRIAVSDEGSGFDSAAALVESRPPAMSALSHRGLYLARHFLDELGYNDIGNRAVLVKRFD